MLLITCSKFKDQIFLTRNAATQKKKKKELPRLMWLSWRMSSACFYSCCQGIGCQCTLGYGGYTVCAASWGTEAIHDMLTKHILTMPPYADDADQVIWYPHALIEAKYKLWSMCQINVFLLRWVWLEPLTWSLFFVFPPNIQPPKCYGQTNATGRFTAKEFMPDYNSQLEIEN